jgi:hypothetical protein
MRRSYISKVGFQTFEMDRLVKGWLVQWLAGNRGSRNRTGYQDGDVPTGLEQRARDTAQAASTTSLEARSKVPDSTGRILTCPEAGQIPTTRVGTAAAPRTRPATRALNDNAADQ